ncbi:hypothetical protein [Mycolicibacterium arenosum]|uniref:Uncharacterized protein n=1 Tax=Mycolicibacterium arenosum TaxID=2952157 RepID=A0ABT1M5F3_9MYCO|nr:hypothetical protein [Mycolicibacterium sp. CAU 1645]MCP9274384.1 hypothetical protein [Mycolicibacterium sp. CAU 1645]
MTQNWTSKLARSTRKLGLVFRTESYPRRSADIDADTRRMRHELDAIRARFPDHA